MPWKVFKSTKINVILLSNFSVSLTNAKTWKLFENQSDRGWHESRECFSGIWVVERNVLLLDSLFVESRDRGLRGECLLNRPVPSFCSCV